jgi:hypothetical protein
MKEAEREDMCSRCQPFEKRGRRDLKEKKNYIDPLQDLQPQDHLLLYNPHVL